MSGIWFDQAEVDGAFQFFESLVLTKSTQSGRPEPWRLLDWHKRFLANLLGWKNPDGTRTHRKAYVSVARKNAKTQLLAGLGLYLLTCDSEMSPEVYAAATDREQASLIFQAASDMIHASEGLSDYLEVTASRKTISNPHNYGVFKALSSEGKTKHGSNPSAVFFDELHAWGSSEDELYAALTTGSGARKSPLQIAITTAGFDQQSICYREYEYAKRILAGTVTDPTYLAMIYEVAEDADWTDEEEWKKANPTLGQIVSIEEMRAECERAKQVPSDQNKFRRLKLNQWTSQETRWLDLAAWDACRVDEAPAAGAEAYGGLDLSSTTDVTAFVLSIPDGDGYYLEPHFWLPAVNLHDRCLRDRVPYDVWHRAGHINLTPGEVVDYDAVFEQIKALCQKYQVRQVAFDRWGAAQIVQRMQDAGIEVVQFGQGYATMSAPTKELLNLVLTHRLRHNGNPVLRWMADCCTVAQDPAGNIKPVKPDRRKNSKRIDGIVAAIMANSLAMSKPNVAAFWTV